MRLYVLVRNDLPIAQQAVQAGHAVEEFQIRNPGRREDETLVYLQVDDIERWIRKMQIRDVDFCEFREPNIGNEITAISIYQDGKLFKSLKLMGGVTTPNLGS